MDLSLAAQSWLSVRRVGDDALSLRDGSLRALLECARPTVGAALGALASLDHPCQVAIQTRRAAFDGNAPYWSRLRASLAQLLAGLPDGRPVLRRLLVVVPGDADDGAMSLADRVAEAERRLHEANLDPVRLRGEALDRLVGVNVLHEGRCDVRTDRGSARALIATGPTERLRPDHVDALHLDHDLSFHIAPGRSARLIELGTYLTLWAANGEALDAADERARALLAAHGVRVRRPYLQAEPALVSGMPLGVDLAGQPRTLPIDAVRPAEQAADDRPLLYGIDPGTRRPLTLDRLRLANPHAVLIGEAGARTRWLLLETVRARLAGLAVQVIDASGSHRRAIADLGGQTIAASAFDPASVPAGPDAIESRVLLMTALIELIAGGLTPTDRAIVEDAVGFAYAARGHAHDMADARPAPPTLDEIAGALERRHVDLATKLREFLATNGPRLLGRRPSLRLGPLGVHDLSALSEARRQVAALLCLDRLWREIPLDRAALVLVDAVDAALVHGAPADFLASLMAAPGRRLGLTLAAGDAEALLGGPLRQFALSGGLVVVLRQQPAGVQALAEALRLTPAEQSWLLRAAPDEGLLIADGRRLAFHSIASDEETRLITGGTP